MTCWPSCLMSCTSPPSCGTWWTCRWGGGEVLLCMCAVCACAGLVGVRAVCGGCARRVWGGLVGARAVCGGWQQWCHESMVVSRAPASCAEGVPKQSCATGLTERWRTASCAAGPQGFLLALPVLVWVGVGQKLCVHARRWCAAPWACPPPPCSSRGLTALHASAWGSAQVGVGAGG